jgi:type II secretory pathway component PulC
MAQDGSLTPEKQLLRLIEDSKSKNVTVQANAIKHRGMSLFSFGAWLGRVSFLQDGLKKRLKAATGLKLDVKLVNRLLFFVVALLVIYFVSDFSVSLSNSKKAPSLKLGVQEANAKSLNMPDISRLKAATYYLEKVRERDIFKMGIKKPDLSNPETVSNRGPSSRIMEATSQLKLVGISWSSDPDAMIEDAKAMRTFFVKRGGMIGEIKVQAIMKDKVVLSYNGEEIELK